MRWKCRNCGRTATTNAPSAKPSGGCCRKDKNGRPIPHHWIKA